MLKPLVLTCLGMLVLACSSTSQNTGQGGGNSGGSAGTGGATGGAGGSSTGGSGGSTGGSAGSGGATGGSAGASGGNAGASGSGGSIGGAGGTGGATGGTGGATGGTGGGGTGGATTCTPNGTCAANETLANCPADCGAWRFVDTSFATSLTTRGDITFTASGSLTQSYTSSAGGASGSCTGCTYTLGSSGLALKLSADASGGVASSNDVAVATYHNAAEQIVMVRKGSGMGPSLASGATYQVFGVMSDGTNTNQQFGLGGKLVFDTNGCLPTSKTNTTSSIKRVDGAGAVLDVTMWGSGGTGSGSGCLTVSSDGVTVLDHMQTTKLPSEGAYVFSGWMAAGGRAILLTRQSGAGFKAGTILLIKQAASGMNSGSTNGTYYVSHLLGGPAKLGVRGTITLSGGTVSGGLLQSNGTSTTVPILGGSYGVTASGGFWSILPQPAVTGYMVGQVHPTATGPVIATYQTTGTVPKAGDPINSPSFMVWVK